MNIVLLITFLNGTHFGTKNGFLENCSPISMSKVKWHLMQPIPKCSNKCIPAHGFLMLSLGSPWVFCVFCPVGRGTVCLFCRLTFQVCLYSEQNWRIETISHCIKGKACLQPILKFYKLRIPSGNSTHCIHKCLLDLFALLCRTWDLE
jgi:hypothetical protein